MLKCAALVTSIAILLFVSNDQSLKSKYRQIETYEIRPGIEMTPFYSAEGDVCKIAIEKRHFNTTAIDLGNMTRKQLDEVFEELAPRTYRGRSALGSTEKEYTTIEGVAEVTVAEYENVSIQMYRNANDKSDTGYAVAVLAWRNRKCR